jgi:glycosyltransferase involved in cell wall biosynthesis
MTADMPEPKARSLISLVIPCYNESAVLDQLQRALVAVADQLGSADDVEIILVDDGSRDDTWLKISRFAAQDPRVRGIRLSRNYGHQAALTCGYDLATGDAIVSMDSDLQDPPEVIPAMIARWKEGADVVHAVRKSRDGESPFKRFTAYAFYRLIQMLGADYVVRDSGDFRLLSRKSLLALRQLREKHRFIRGMVGWVGFKTAHVEYARAPRAAGETHYPLVKMLRLAFDGIISFSAVPLRVTYYAALAISSISLLYLIYGLINHFVYGAQLVSGWSSLILVMTLFGTSNLICLGIMGEYVGRIFEQVKDRPLYLVDEAVGSEGRSL